MTPRAHWVPRGALLLTILVLLFARAATAQTRPGEKNPQRNRTFIPLGVDWAGEYAYREESAAKRWQRIQQDLENLRRRHVNAVWLTHQHPPEMAAFARRAEEQGIYLVACPFELAGEQPNIRQGDHPEKVSKVLSAWGAAPLPIAWGLGDEPRAEYMQDIYDMAAAWRRRDPREPLTVVVKPDDMDAVAKVGFEEICCDVYPFYRPPYGMSYDLPPLGERLQPWDTWRKAARYVVAAAPRAWMMGQAMQQPRGPFDIDANGHVVVLPGGAWREMTEPQFRSDWAAPALKHGPCRPRRFGLVFMRQAQFVDKHRVTEFHGMDATWPAKR